MKLSTVGILNNLCGLNSCGMRRELPCISPHGAGNQLKANQRGSLNKFKTVRTQWTKHELMGFKILMKQIKSAYYVDRHPKLTQHRCPLDPSLDVISERYEILVGHLGRRKGSFLQSGSHGKLVDYSSPRFIPLSK